MRSIVAVLAAGLALFTGTASAASVRPTERVLLRPSALHPGDVVYVSGRRFKPHHRLVVQVACSGATLIMRGPRTNARGRFAGFAARTPANGRGRCTVYAGLANGGPLARATFRVVPRGEALPHCSVHMCLHVKALLVRLRNGTQGTVVVTGWPGAAARIKVTGPTIHAKYRRVRLNWRGVASVRLRVALGLVKSTASHVSVIARLGHVYGRATTHFVVIPGGR